MRNQSEWVFKEEKEEAPPSLVLNRGEVLATPPPKTQSSRKHLLFRRRRERRKGNKRLCYLFFSSFFRTYGKRKEKVGKPILLPPFWFSFWRGRKKMHRMFAKKITRAMRHEPRISAPSLLLLPSYNILHLLIAAIIIIFFLPSPFRYDRHFPTPPFSSLSDTIYGRIWLASPSLICPPKVPREFLPRKIRAKHFSSSPLKNTGKTKIIHTLLLLSN